MQALAAGCPLLAKLVLTGCVHVTDVGIAALAHGCRSLVELACNGLVLLTDVGVAALFENCAIEALHLVDCRRIQLLCPLGALALRRAVLTGCEAIEDAGLASLTAAAPRLSRINLWGCRRLSSASLAAALSPLELCEARLASTAVHGVLGASLEELHIEGSAGDEEWCAIGARCPSLEILVVSSCGGLSDVGAKAVGAGCPKLRQLTCTTALGLQDGGMRALLAGCALSHVTLRRCPRVSAGMRQSLSASGVCVWPLLDEEESDGESESESDCFTDPECLSGSEMGRVIWGDGLMDGDGSSSEED